MSNAVYHIIVIVVAVLSLMKGYRNGFTGQVSGILGFAFGAVCAHVFGSDAADIWRDFIPGINGHIGAAFIYSVLGSVTVYVIVYCLFSILTGVLRKAMEVFEVGIVDSLFGSAFCLLKYMLFLSILYNLILCVNPTSPLLKYANADDGNVVECVMFLAPACLGCGNVDDLFHLIQLKEAKKISRNLIPLSGVIHTYRRECVEKILIENA